AVNTVPGMLSSSAAVAEASQSAMSPAPTSTYDAAAAVTVRADVPVTVSDVAAMLAVPAVTPLTIPLPVTVATAVLFDAQATVRPVSVLPFASLRVAVSWTVWPVGTEDGAGVTVTEATGAGAGAVTVMAEVPLLPSLVAVIVAEPAVTPVTSPLPPTVATALLLLAQVTVRPLSGFPFASFGVAASCTVWPACTDAVAGLTVTDATGTVLTVIVAVPPCPSLVAVIVAEPAVTPVPSPPPLTVATAVSLLAQLTPRPARQRGPGHRDAARRGDVPRVAGRRDREGASGGASVVPVVALAGGARVDAPTRRAPRHGDIGAVARGREADGEEVLSLVLLQ